MGLYRKKTKDPAVNMHFSSLVVMLKALQDGQIEFVKTTLVATIMAIQSKYVGQLDNYIAFDTRGRIVDVPPEVMAQIAREAEKKLVERN